MMARADDSLPGVLDGLDADELPPSKLGSDGDVAEPLALAEHQTGRPVLEQADERRTEQTRRLNRQPPLLGILNGMKQHHRRIASDAPSGMDV